MSAFSPLSPCRFAHWLRFDGWPIHQAVFVLCGWEPPVLHELRPPKVDHYSMSSSPPRWGDVFDSRWDDRTTPLMSPADWTRALEVRNLYAILAMAISGKQLQPFNHYEGTRVWDAVKPRDVIRWATNKALDLPPELMTWFKGQAAENLAKEMTVEAPPCSSPALAKEAVKESVKEAPLIYPPPIKRNEEQITTLIKEVLEQAGALRSRNPNISVQGIAAKLASPPLFEQFRRAGAVASELNFQNYLAQRIGKLLAKTKY